MSFIFSLSGYANDTFVSERVTAMLEAHLHNYPNIITQTDAISHLGEMFSVVFTEGKVEKKFNKGRSQLFSEEFCLFCYLKKRKLDNNIQLLDDMCIKKNLGFITVGKSHSSPSCL